MNTYIARATFNNGTKVNTIPEGQFKVNELNHDNLRKNMIARLGYPKSARGFWIDFWSESGRPVGTLFFTGYVGVGPETWTWRGPKADAEYTVDARTGKLVGPDHFSDAWKNRHLIKGKTYVKIRSASYSNYKYSPHEYMDVLYGADGKVYLGRNSRYDSKGNYDNTDNSLVYLSDNDDIFYLVSASGYGVPQNQMYSAKTYTEFQKLRKGVLSKFIEVRVPTFAGVPFKAPRTTSARR